jgi:hypothetical protein
MVFLTASPSCGDVFLDFESNPYVLDQGLEYLMGILTFPPQTMPVRSLL